MPLSKRGQERGEKGKMRERVKGEGKGEGKRGEGKEGNKGEGGKEGGGKKGKEKGCAEKHSHFVASPPIIFYSVSYFPITVQQLILVYHFYISYVVIADSI